MRRYFILGVFLFFGRVALSQAIASSVVMGGDFNQVASASKRGGNHTDAGFLQTYSSNQIDGSQFYFPDWKKGAIITNSNNVFDQDLLLVYDKVRQELFIRQKDSSLILTGNKEEIKSFTLKNEGNTFTFVNSSLYSELKPEIFYQVLVSDSARFTLLKYNNTKFVKADKTDMMRQKEGNVYDAFVDDYTYYIVKGKGAPVLVQLKTKAVRKVFTDMGVNPDKYMNDHYSPIDEDYLVGMVTELNK